MSDDVKTAELPVRFLHGARPNGAHCWAGFRTVEELAIQVDRLCAQVPADTVWDVTETTRAPRREETL